MVEIIDNPERLRRESYEHINKLLQPNFYLQSMGTGADIHIGRCPTYDNKLVGQCDNVNSHPVGRLFLYWDNVKVKIEGDPKTFYDVAVKLEEHNFRVTIEV